MASEQLRAIVEMMRNAPTPTEPPTIEQQRAGMEAMSSQPPPDDVDITDMEVAGRPARRFRPQGARTDRGILYLHGGGYVMGSLNTHSSLMGRLANACGATVLGLDYRLAPEHPYPAAVEDAVATFQFGLNSGMSAANIMIAGDSAGGGLTLACMLALREKRLPMPGCAALFSPWTDLTASGDSVQSRADADPMIRPDVLTSMSTHYIGDTDPKTPGISPLFGDLAGLPPMLIQVGDAEVLLDDSTRLADIASTAGVKAELKVFDEAFHVFQAIAALPESEQALADVGTFFNQHIP